MSDINKPAFPRPIGTMNGRFNDDQRGMTLLEHYTGLAMQGMCHAIPMLDFFELDGMADKIAKTAVAVARATIKEIDKC